jgi:hypothetical protein
MSGFAFSARFSEPSWKTSRNRCRAEPGERERLSISAICMTPIGCDGRRSGWRSRRASAAALGLADLERVVGPEVADLTLKSITPPPAAALAGVERFGRLRLPELRDRDHLLLHVEHVATGERRLVLEGARLVRGQDPAADADLVGLVAVDRRFIRATPSRLNLKWTEPWSSPVGSSRGGRTAPRSAPRAGAPRARRTACRRRRPRRRTTHRAPATDHARRHAVDPADLLDAELAGLEELRLLGCRGEARHELGAVGQDADRVAVLRARVLACAATRFMSFFFWSSIAPGDLDAERERRALPEEPGGVTPASRAPRRTQGASPRAG